MFFLNKSLNNCKQSTKITMQLFNFCFQEDSDQIEQLKVVRTCIILCYSVCQAIQSNSVLTVVHCEARVVSWWTFEVFSQHYSNTIEYSSCKSAEVENVQFEVSVPSNFNRQLNINFFDGLICMILPSQQFKSTKMGLVQPTCALFQF